MAFVEANGITLAYDEAGAANAPVLLMIHGLGAQLIRWPQALCDGLVASGFRIVRYDSRDVGLSTKMDGAPIADLATIAAAKAQGRAIDLPYTLSDLAGDAMPSAWFLAIGGMGHDLPGELTRLFVATIAANCARAERRA